MASLATSVANNVSAGPRRPRVLHIITRIDRGGSAEVVLDIAARQRAAGYEVALAMGVSLEPQVDPDEYERQTGVRIVRIKALQREVSPLADTRALFALYRLAREIKPDLIHTHTSKAGFVGRAAAWLARVPATVHSPHGHIFYGYYGEAKTHIFIVLERLAARFCNRVTTLTDLGARDHVELRIATADRFATIRPGVDISRFLSRAHRRAPIRAELGVKPDELLVCWVGRLVPIKDCATFVRACAEVVRSKADVRFVIVGDGELRSQLETQAEEQRVPAHFLGNRSDVPDLMAASDLFVLSSTNEGFGRVLVEAMASGLPIVATAVGGVPEVVEHGRSGLVVPPGDSSAMADAMLQLLRDDACRAAFRQRGLERVPEFSIERTMEDLGRLYGELLPDRFGKN